MAIHRHKAGRGCAMNEGQIEFIDMKPKLADFRKGVLDGLSSDPKTISPKFFYDREGSELFEKITTTPEYYVTNAEESILAKYGDEIAEEIGSEAYVIEYGSGKSNKTRILISQLEDPAAYALIDISSAAVQASAEHLSSIYPGLRVISICADYLEMDEIPSIPGSKGKVIVFFGSTLGNFEPTDADAFLKHCADSMTGKDGMLLGVDFIKSEDVLNRAYNDEEGYTAKFNLNLLERIRRRLDSDVDPAKFRHKAFYNSGKNRIEMHLESLEDQDVSVEGKKFHFGTGETIHTENSYKFSQEQIRKMAENSGLRTVRMWTDDNGYFGLFFLRKK